MSSEKGLQPVLVTTAHRGVFAGLLSKDQDWSQKTLTLKSAKMAIRWGTTKGVMQLAKDGPPNDSLIGAEADIPVLHDVTAIFLLTPEAWEKWKTV